MNQKNTFIKFQKQLFIDVFENKWIKISQLSQKNACAGVTF